MHNALKRSGFALIAVAILVAKFMATEAQATTLTPVTELDLVNKASLIFEGTVTSVRYRLSDQRDKNDAVLPYTYVTFKVEKVLKGKPETPDSVTLRFVGGPKDKRTLVVPGVPLFNVGDHDILFASGSPSHVCPLVGWNQGRFRIVGERVYTDDGRAAVLSKDRRLVYGRDRELKDPRTNQIGPHSVTRTPRSPASNKDKEPAEPIGQALTKDEFVTFIINLVNQIPKAQLDRVRPFSNARFDAVFYAPKLTPRPPPKVGRE